MPSESHNGENTSIDAAMPRNAAPITSPTTVFVNPKSEASGSEMSPRIMNEKAEVIRARQLATNRRRWLYMTARGVRIPSARESAAAGTAVVPCDSGPVKPRAAKTRSLQVYRPLLVGRLEVKAQFRCFGVGILRRKSAGWRGRLRGGRRLGESPQLGRVLRAGLFFS